MSDQSTPVEQTHDIYEAHTINAIGGVKISELVEKFGSPLYVYDLDVIKHQYERMNQAFSSFKHSIHYAVKANNNISVLKFIASLGASVDTVSVEEIEFSFMAGFTADKVIFTPSGPSDADVDWAMERNIMMTADSLQVIEHIGTKYGGKYPISIRLNPMVFTGGDDKISVAGAQSKFGLDINLIDQARTLCEKFGIKCVGLHIHTGSDISNANDYFQAVDNLIKVALNFDSLNFIDLGSGFKVSYHSPSSYDKDTNLDAYAIEMKNRYDQLHSKFGDNFEIKFEPGKYIVCKSGYLVTTASVVKESNGANFVIVDSGLNHLIRPMMYSKAYHLITNASNIKGNYHKYNVCGYICETDTFGYDRDIVEVRKGDHLVIHNAGAYGMTMASNYNCKLRPAEVAVTQGTATLVRRRETLADTIATQIVVDLKIPEQGVLKDSTDQYVSTGIKLD